MQRENSAETVLVIAASTWTFPGDSTQPLNCSSQMQNCPESKGGLSSTLGSQGTQGS